MQSSGGVMTADAAARRPVFALESGPAAGVVAALSLARGLGIENAIAFDMGGTTAKASLVEAGRVSRSREYEVGASLSAGSRLLRGSGELIRIPTIDIAEVGAGGGSVAWLDAGGALHVGPRSAGAAPGPGLLRERRRGADRHRRERRARLHPDRTARERRSHRRRRSSPPGALAPLADVARAGRGRGRARHPRPRERVDDARAAVGLVREGPRPARLRARRLRRLGPHPRGRPRRRARRRAR